MSGQDQDDTKHKNCNNGAGVAQSPVHQPFYRQTLGLPTFREKSPEQLAREEARIYAHEGNWDLNELRRQMAERKIQPSKPASNSRHFESKRGASRVDPKTQMLNLGKYLLEKSLFIHPPEEFFVDCIMEDLDALFKPAGLQNIWRSFANLSEMQQRILNKRYEMGLEYLEDGIVSFLPEELQATMAKFQMNLVAILAFLDSQKASRSACEDTQIPPAPTSEEGEKTMSPEKPKGKKRINRGGMNAILSSSTNIILREIGIEHVNNLTRLKSYALVAKLADRKRSSKTIKAIASNMLKYDLFFADGEEATRDLMTYDPKTYRPPVETPESAPPPEAPTEKVGTITAAVAPVEPESGPIETALRIIGKKLDELATGETPVSCISFRGNITGASGKKYRVVIEEQNLLPLKSAPTE